MALHLLFLLAFLVKAASGGHDVTTLPGYPGDLPFSLETGYIGVGDNENVQLFYYFVKSQGNPAEDPLLLWITGGPGYSSLWALFYEFGPLSIDYENYNYDGSLPNLIDNKYAWTEYFNIIFLDGPAGTGFSYSKTDAGYYSGDSIFVDQLHEFIKKWLALAEHSKFSQSDLYVSGDGYCGKPLPILVQRIIDGNKNSSEPRVNIRGYVLVSPGTDNNIDFNARYTFAHRMGYIPNRLYKDAKANCNGNFIDTTQNNDCASNMTIISELIENITLEYVLDNSCKDVIVTTMKLHDTNLARRSLKEKSRIFLNSLSDSVTPKFCRKVIHWIPSNTWANNEEVQKALHIHPGSISSWVYFNATVDDVTYAEKSTSVISYHKSLSNTNLRGIIMSGDHDMDIPNIGVQKWIWQLNLTLDERWRTCSVDNETAGYTRKFSNGAFSLTYVLVKGGGHFLQEYKPYESYVLMKRWLANKPL